VKKLVDKFCWYNYIRTIKRRADASLAVTGWQHAHGHGVTPCPWPYSLVVTHRIIVFHAEFQLDWYLALESRPMVYYAMPSFTVISKYRSAKRLKKWHSSVLSRTVLQISLGLGVIASHVHLTGYSGEGRFWGFSSRISDEGWIKAGKPRLLKDF